MRQHWKQLAIKARSVVQYEDLLPSPCASVCRMTPGDWCEGCLRTMDEIRQWSTCDDETKRRIWRSIQLRIEERLGAT